jgi:hypothetical protein
LQRAEQKGFRFEEMNYSRILEKHKPQPSLLHGDLWSGNAGFTVAGPVIFDPAVYYKRICSEEKPIQPVSPAQPPEPVRRRLPRAGEGDATPFG